MSEATSVRRQFDIVAASEPQLELRLHWFGHALERRQGHIVNVSRRRAGGGQHVASIAYEMPLPEYRRRATGTRRSGRKRLMAQSSSFGSGA